MKSDSELISELSRTNNCLRELTPEECQALKKALLAIYVDVARLCEQNGLTVMHCGGSCLGAVRHKGFIPWDDDLDLMMPRKDYESLIRLLEQGKLGNNYEFDTPNPKTDAQRVFLKIYRKNTLNVDIYSDNSPYPKGISIDVFALDAVPRTKFGQVCKGFLANALQFISILVLYAKYPSPSLKALMSLDPAAKRRYRLKCALGMVFGLIPHRKWVWWFDRFVASDKENRPWGIPTGRKYYNGEIFPKEVFVPAQPAEFEGLKVYIPNNCDAYLRNLYCDYMQLPPVEKRERHFIVQFQLQQV